MMDENITQTIIETLARALQDEKLLREFYEKRTKELEKELAEKDGLENG